MKKLNFRHLLGVALVATAISACEKNPMGDEPISTEPGFAKISLTKKDNTFLDKDYVGEVGSGVTFYVAPAFKDSTKYVFDYILSNADLIFFNDDTLSYGETVTLKETNSFKLINTLDEKTVEYPISVIYTDNAAALSKVFVEKVAFVSDSLQTLLNYSVDEITSKMSLGLPAELKGKSVIVKLDATIDDVIKVDGEVYKDSLVFDTTFPCEIEVKDTVMNKTTTYTLSVSNGTLSMEWNELKVYGDGVVDSHVHLAVDEVSGDPYFTYNAFDDKYLAVSKYNTKTAQVDSIGSRNINYGKKEGASNYGVTDMLIEVYDGKIYAFATDKQFSSAASVYAYDGSKWGLLGNGGDIAKITGNSYYKAAMTLDPTTWKPIVAICSNAAVSATGLAKRGAGISTWDGSKWTANIPLSARGANDGYAYTPRMARSNDAVYLLYANHQLNNYSLYKYANGAWSCVVDKDLTTSSVCINFADVAVDSKGNVYVALADNSSGNYLCAIYTVVDGKFKKVGNYLPSVIFSSRSYQFDLTFDGNDNPVLVYLDAGDNNYIKMVSLDLSNSAWGPIYNTEQTANSYYLSADNDKNGNVYVAFTQKIDTKYSIVLWKGTTKK